MMSNLHHKVHRMLLLTMAFVFVFSLAGAMMFERVRTAQASTSPLANAQGAIVSADGGVTIVALPKAGAEPSKIEEMVLSLDDKLGESGNVSILDNPEVADPDTAVTLETEKDTASAVIEEMKACGLFDAVDYEHSYETMYTSLPNDYYFRNGTGQWDVKSTGYGAKFDSVWGSLGTAASPTSVSVAVIDTGIYLNHENTGPNTVAGYDFGDNKPDITPIQSSTNPAHLYHGTFVSGLIASKTNDGIGIAGAAWDTKLVGYKVINKNGSIPTSSVVNAIMDAVDKKVDVINISLGGIYNDQVLATACLKAYQAGVVVVAASGNGASSSSGGFVIYPAANEGVMSVGAIDPNGNRSYFSTYNRYIDMVAPGEGMTGMTYPTSSYQTGMGTSYASPLVASACVLLKRYYPSLDASQIKDIVNSSARDLGSPGWDQQTGWGALDMKAANALAKTGVRSATAVSLSRSSATLTKGNRLTLSAAMTPVNTTSKVGWFSSDPSTVSISQSGTSATITGLQTGSATVYARTTNGIQKTCRITVVPVSIKVFGGASRYDVSANVSKGVFVQSPAVIVASGEVYPDALAASSLSGFYNAPILLTSGASLTPQARSEIVRLGAKKIYVVGGSGTVSNKVIEQLKLYGSVKRIGGGTRFSTAKMIADHLVSAGVKPTAAFVVSGENFPDALSVSPFAARNKMPILLTRAPSLDTYASAFLANNGIKTVYIAGGPASVSPGIEAGLRARGISVVRFGGATRYDVSRSVANGGMSRWGSAPALVGVASGENFPDALSGGASLGLQGRKGVLLLTKPSPLSTQAASVLSSKKSSITTVEIYGGPASVTPSTRAQIAALF